MARFLSIGAAGVGRCPRGGEGESCPQGVVELPGDSPVSPPLDIPLWPASRVSVRDRGTQLTLSGTAACVNGHELRDFKEQILFLWGGERGGCLKGGGGGLWRGINGVAQRQPGDNEERRRVMGGGKKRQELMDSFPLLSQTIKISSKAFEGLLLSII